ncbi:MAG: mechanosensitive ion channel family protein [Nanobdellota archaeon]
MAILDDLLPIIITFIGALVAIIFFNILITKSRKILLKRSKTKKQKSNIEIFTKVMKVIVVILVLVIAIFSYFGSLTGLGVGLGIFSAGLGWALQKPITSVAAWIMIITKRPFEIGDRVIVGGVRGDVSDITTTHFYLKEIGGIVAGEENSGRIIIVPNSVLFDREIINYHGEDEFVLDEVSVVVTYESNLDKAIKVGVESAKKVTKDVIKATGRQPYVRTYFKPDGVSVQIRYFSYSVILQEISSNITQEVFRRFSKENDLRIAYPHREIVTKK